MWNTLSCSFNVLLLDCVCEELALPLHQCYIFLGARVCFRSGLSSNLQSFQSGSLAVKLTCLCSSPRQVQHTHPSLLQGIYITLKRPAECNIIDSLQQGYNNQRIWTVLLEIYLGAAQVPSRDREEGRMRGNNEQEIRVIYGQCCFSAFHVFECRRSEGSSNKCRHTQSPSCPVPHTRKQTVEAPQPSGTN